MKPFSENKRKKLIRQIREYRSVSDVIAYLLALRERTKISADDEIIHRAFFRLKEEHPELLKDLAFSHGDIFPFSNELQRSFFNLQSSGMLEAINPVYEVYRFPKKSKDLVISNLSNNFSDAEKEEMRQMSRRLEELLSTRIS